MVLLQLLYTDIYLYSGLYELFPRDTMFKRSVLRAIQRTAYLILFHTILYPQHLYLYFILFACSVYRAIRYLFVYPREYFRK